MKGLTIPLIVCLLLALLSVPPALAQAPTGEIVFNRDEGIYIMSADGSHVRLLTDYGLWPAWSPDGTKIAFGRWGSTWCDGFVMFADGSGDTLVEGDPIADEYRYTHPTWSPDGRQILWSEETRDGVWEQDLSLDGNKIVSSCFGEDWQVDICVENLLTDTYVNLTNDPADDREPAWSPDSTKIAFASNRGGNYDIYVMNADGSGLQRLMDNHADDREPVWSPDGTQLAFTRIMPNGNGDIFIMKTNGGNQINITNNPADDKTPDWKPTSQMNGRRVLLVSSSTAGQVDGIRFRDEDILAYDLSTDTWQMYFDGSDVGLGGNDVDALGVNWNGDLLLSLNAPQPISSLGKVDDSDIVSFVQTNLGRTTTGRFESHFDGAYNDLTTEGEDIDAIGYNAGGWLILSTMGNFNIDGGWLIGTDKDLVSIFGRTGYLVDLDLEGSTVSLTQPSEDISDVWFNGDDLYLSTIGPFSVPGLSGDGADIFICHKNWTPEEGTTCTFTPFWDGSAHGFGGEVIDAFDIIYATELPVTAAGIDEPEADEVDDTVGDDVADDASAAGDLYYYFLPLINQQ